MPDLNLGDLTVTTDAFAHGGAIPDRHANGADDISPAVSWTGVPDGTAELVLVVHDPDAPLTDGFTHWVVHGLPADSTGIDEGDHGSGAGGTVGKNELGDTAYMGPAPPPGHGDHHYFFHLYAVDQPLGDTPLSRPEVLEAIDGHIIEQARVVGTYAN